MPHPTRTVFPGKFPPLHLNPFEDGPSRSPRVRLACEGKNNFPDSWLSAKFRVVDAGFGQIALHRPRAAERTGRPNNAESQNQRGETP